MSQPPEKMRILLIDDDQVDRTMVRRALAKSGLDIEFFEAADGATGLRLAAAQPFDCVLLDYRLPDIDAFDILRELLANQAENAAVLMLTGEADQETALRLMSAGALDYLSKADATPENLSRSIRYALARKTFLSELDAARKTAEQKSQALDALNQQKNLLFSIIAHDLRNPFQALLGSAYLLNRAVAKQDNEMVERLAQNITQASGQAHALMESLFAWANLQMDTMEVTKDHLPLHELVGEVFEGGAEPAQAKNLSLESACENIGVYANRDMLIAILRNLVNNAVKFTPNGGAIRIQAQDSGTTVEITVSDTGVGIPEDYVREIFKLDRRMTTEGTAGEKGTGLGLLLCRELAERQGATLSVRSAVGAGTSFCITLPRA